MHPTMVILITTGSKVTRPRDDRLTPIKLSKDGPLLNVNWLSQIFVIVTLSYLTTLETKLVLTPT
jgi:hypothetical protein